MFEELTDDEFKFNRLFCQHCKAIQKVADIEADCLYNPLLDEGKFAFCSANIDAVNSIKLELRAAEAKRDKQWIEWGEEICDKHSHFEGGIKINGVLKRNCFFCWQELRNQLEVKDDCTR